MHVHNVPTTFLVMHHLRALVELYQCTKFRVTPSKFPEVKKRCLLPMDVRALDATHHKEKMSIAYGCTCTRCNSSSSAMYHRITHIELHQCTKFGVPSSKFPRTGGPHSNKVFRSWRAHLASHENGNRKSVQIRTVYV